MNLKEDSETILAEVIESSVYELVDIYFRGDQSRAAHVIVELDADDHEDDIERAYKVTLQPVK